MTFHNAMILGAAVCFGLAAFAVVTTIVNLAILAMCFFALSFYTQTP